MIRNWKIKKMRELSILYPKNLIAIEYNKLKKNIIQGYLLTLIICITMYFAFGKDSVFAMFAVVVPVMVSAIISTKISKASEELIRSISLEMPDFVHQISILITAGININQTLEIIYKSQSKNSGIYRLLQMLYFELDRGLNINEALNIVTDIVRIRSFNNFSVIYKQAVKNGMQGVSDKLMKLSDDTIRDRQFDIKQVAERLSSKMLMPLMISLIGIMMMLLIPVSLQMNL